jgi:hypothetical protein
MMESVFCDFTKLPGDAGKPAIKNYFPFIRLQKLLSKGFQKWIGYTEVKSAPAHFYVQRNATFSTPGYPIPFDLALVNEGNAMNLASGIFTAPVPGIYFFSFTKLAGFPATASSVYVQIGLYLNGGLIGTVRAEDGNPNSYQYSPLSTLQSTLNLKIDDQVWVEIISMSSGAWLLTAVTT